MGSRFYFSRMVFEGTNFHLYYLYGLRNWKCMALAPIENKMTKLNVDLVHNVASFKFNFWAFIVVHASILGSMKCYVGLWLEPAEWVFKIVEGHIFVSFIGIRMQIRFNYLLDLVYYSWSQFCFPNPSFGSQIYDILKSGNFAYTSPQW